MLCVGCQRGVVWNNFSIFRRILDVSHVRGTMDLFNDFSRGVELVRDRFSIAILGHNSSLGVDNRTRGITGTAATVRHLLTLVGGNRTLSSRGIQCIVSLIGSNRRSGLVSLSNSYIYVASGNGPMGPGALNRGGCIRTVQGGAVILNTNPTNANGACLTITVTIATFHTGRIGHVVLAHPTIRTNRGLKFLPNSLRRGISPCLEPLCSTLFSVLKTRTFTHCRRHNSVRITPLTCVHNEALSSDFVVLSRTRGAAHRRVGVFLAHLNFGSGVMMANSIARVSLPSKGESKLASTVEVLEGIPSVSVGAFARGSMMERGLMRSVVGTCRGGRRGEG